MYPHGKLGVVLPSLSNQHGGSNDQTDDNPCHSQPRPPQGCLVAIRPKWTRYARAEDFGFCPSAWTGKRVSRKTSTFLQDKSSARQSLAPTLLASCCETEESSWTLALRLYRRKNSANSIDGSKEMPSSV